MNKLSNKLKELMGKEVKVKDLQEYLNFNSTSLIYKWINNSCTPSFEYLVKLADFFNVNIDYLIGRTESLEKTTPQKLPEFSTHFKKVLNDQKSSQYQLLKDNIVSNGHLNSWLNLKNLPSTDNLIRLADYLKISIDELIGRV